MPGTNLTRVEAQERASIVTSHSYEVALDLTTGPETFAADTTVRFDATAGAATFIDVIADSVESIELNGAELNPAELFADSRIQLPNLAAENTLRIRSTMRYMNTGEGLHRFEDPADGEVYLYSQFEVPDSRRMFPVFRTARPEGHVPVHDHRAGALEGRLEPADPGADPGGHEGRRAGRRLG